MSDPVHPSFDNLRRTILEFKKSFQGEWDSSDPLNARRHVVEYGPHDKFVVNGVEISSEFLEVITNPRTDRKVLFRFVLDGNRVIVHSYYEVGGVIDYFTNNEEKRE